MTQREKDLEEIITRLEKQRPEIDRILSRPSQPKSLIARVRKKAPIQKSAILC